MAPQLHFLGTGDMRNLKFQPCCGEGVHGKVEPRVEFTQQRKALLTQAQQLFFHPGDFKTISVV